MRGTLTGEVVVPGVCGAGDEVVAPGVAGVMEGERALGVAGGAIGALLAMGGAP